MKVLIVDDEEIALVRLENALACIPDAVLVGRATTGRQALALVREARPDVLLLDINMPGQGGLAVAQALVDADHRPEIIFVTALDQHAIQAFELHATDYLLKPVAFERLREALRRAQERLRARAADRRFAELDKVIDALKAQRRGPYDTEIWVSSRLGVDRVSVDNVTVFRAEGDYVAVETQGKSLLLKESLSSLQARLDPETFMRVHRSSVVNMRRVKALRRREPRGLALILDDAATVEVGPSYTNEVVGKLNAKTWR